MLDIDALIKESTLKGDNVKRDTYRLIKTKFLEYKTSKEAIKKPFNDEIELNILRKMKKELEEDIEIYKTAKPELAKEYSNQLEVVKEFLPKEISEYVINDTIDCYVAERGAYTNKEMGAVIKFVMAILPTADKSLVAKLIKSRL